MVKQFYVKNAYSGNYHVIECVDGKIDDVILAYYELDGYIRALKNKGYTEAYYLPEFEKEFEEAKDAYERANAAYEEAKKHPLLVSKEEANKYYFLKIEERPR